MGCIALVSLHSLNCMRCIRCIACVAFIALHSLHCIRCIRCIRSLYVMYWCQYIMSHDLFVTRCKTLHHTATHGSTLQLALGLCIMCSIMSHDLFAPMFHYLRSRLNKHKTHATHLSDSPVVYAKDTVNIYTHDTRAGRRTAAHLNLL